MSRRGRFRGPYRGRGRGGRGRRGGRSGGGRRFHPDQLCKYYMSRFGCRDGDRCRFVHAPLTAGLRRACFEEYSDPRYTLACPLRGGLRAIPWHRIRTVRLFDFDGTLVVTPTREKGAIEFYEEKTGTEWPHGRSFYGVVASLEDPFPIVKGPAFDECFASPVLASEDDDRTVLTCVLTGRREAFRRRIWEILDELGLSSRVAVAAFTPAPWPLGSVEYKKAFLERFLIAQCPKVRRITMWDDNRDDCVKFEEWGSHSDVDVVVHCVADELEALEASELEGSGEATLELEESGDEGDETAG